MYLLIRYIKRELAYNELCLKDLTESAWEYDRWHTYYFAKVNLLRELLNFINENRL